jgi:starch synthase
LSRGPSHPLKRLPPGRFRRITFHTLRLPPPLSAAPLPSVLFATSEVAPLVKTGGLADVSASLPAALAALGADVRLLLPGYPAIAAGVRERCRVASLPGHAGLPASTLLSGRLASGVRCYVIDCPPLYGRAGNPYTDSVGADWTDNPLRFGLLSWVAALLARDAAALGWRPDVLHCNDWQTGLAPAYLAFARAGSRPASAAATPCASVFTVHNLAFGGNFDARFVARLGLPRESFSINGLEYYGQLSFLKAGLYYAERITTVSPTYAREIQSEPLGFGLQGLLAGRAGRLSGILNGIDEAGWSPRTDPHLAAPFDADSLDARAANRQQLGERLGLAADPEAMLLGVVSRFTEQKGIDLVLDAWPRLIERGHRLQLAMLGSGDRILTQRAHDLARRHPGQVAFVEGFDEPLSHLIEGGIDAFLMPSRFEPCGLNQMYSQRYGAPPIVRATGGLADSVRNAGAGAAGVDATDGAGFVFEAATPAALATAIERALAAWHDRPRWRAIQAAGMRRDFGWRASAQRYAEVYRLAIDDARTAAARTGPGAEPAARVRSTPSSPARTDE